MWSVMTRTRIPLPALVIVALMAALVAPSAASARVIEVGTIAGEQELPAPELSGAPVLRGQPDDGLPGQGGHRRVGS